MRLRTFLSYLFALALSVSMADRADAQIFRRIFGGKEEPKSAQRIAPPRPAPPRPKPQPPRRLSHSDQLQYPRSERKNRYRIDVFASLYLDELVKGGKSTVKLNIPDKAAPGLNFYEGIKLAADSLDALGYRLDVHVHDLTSALTAPETMINTGGLDSSDLIIGAVGPNLVAPLARFAKRQQVNFISVLSPTDGGVKDNFFFTLLQPTLQTHIKGVRQSAERAYGRRIWTVYHRKLKAADNGAYDSLMKGKKDGFREVMCDKMPLDDQLFLYFDSTATNVVVMPILDAAYAEKLLQQLSTAFPNYSFDVWGMPTWKSMPILHKAGSLPNMTVRVTAPFYFDASTGSGSSLARQYLKTFGGKPTEMTYRGFEVLFWYAGLLQRHGVVFNAQAGTGASAIFTRYNVQPKWDDADRLLYNENNHLYQYQYRSGSYSVEP